MSTMTEWKLVEMYFDENDLLSSEIVLSSWYGNEKPTKEELVTVINVYGDVAGKYRLDQSTIMA